MSVNNVRLFFSSFCSTFILQAYTHFVVLTKRALSWLHEIVETCWRLFAHYKRIIVWDKEKIPNIAPWKHKYPLTYYQHSYLLAGHCSKEKKCGVCDPGTRAGKGVGSQGYPMCFFCYCYSCFLRLEWCFFVKIMHVTESPQGESVLINGKGTRKSLINSRSFPAHFHSCCTGRYTYTHPENNTTPKAVICSFIKKLASCVCMCAEWNTEREKVGAFSL